MAGRSTIVSDASLSLMCLFLAVLKAETTRSGGPEWGGLLTPGDRTETAGVRAHSGH